MPSTKDIDLLPKLNSALANENWEDLSNILNPKLFGSIDSGELIAFQVLSKVAQILTSENSPESVTIKCLKCLGNSCFNGYKYKEYPSNNLEKENCYYNLYATLAESIECLHTNGLDTCNAYPQDSHFPYEGIAEWAVNYIVSNSSSTKLSENELEILRLAIQFLCNLFTFACIRTNYEDHSDIPECLNHNNFKLSIIDLIHSNHMPLVKATCAFVHNALKELHECYFKESEKYQLCHKLVKPVKEGFTSAKDALLFLLCQLNTIRYIYEDLSMEDKLFILEIIYNYASESVYQSKDECTCIFTKDAVDFLSERFCKRSDTILKIVDTYLDGIEPTEIIILLDILGALTSADSKENEFLRAAKSLLINCAYLLKSVHMIGKESDNFFTPMQKLCDVAPAAQGITIQERLTENKSATETEVRKNVKTEGIKSDPYSHPAFGFKAGLIRVIGNMSYKNKVCQDLLREMDVIPLLLDCCNIDARNPLIMQWTILALHNLCEGNPENQEIIRNCTKVGIVDNTVLKEMGLTLHDEGDGKKIGIVPLVRGQEK